MTRIAREDGIQAFDKGTVSREIRRESDMRGYHRYRGEMVYAETIYRWIWQEKRRGNDEMARNLRHGGMRRPIGDFEIDTIIGSNRKGAIMTTNDRCMHFVLIRRLEGKEAVPLASTARAARL